AKVAGLLDATWYKPGVYVRQDTDPRERVVLREGGAGSVASDARLVSRDSVVPFAGTVVRLPEPGTWHLAEWPRRSEELPPPDTVRYLVAWRDTLEVWVDLNRNHD